MAKLKKKFKSHGVNLFGEAVSVPDFDPPRALVYPKSHKSPLLKDADTIPYKEWFFKVNPSHTVSYWRTESISAPNRTSFSKMLRKNNATLSDKATANLRNCFNWLQLISNLKEVYSMKEKKTFKFKLCFITLTLSDTQVHSDEFIKSHLLEPFLKWMARSWQANSYIWKAEVQNNGNIHFHVTTNKFIHWKSIRKKWNRLLSNHGYCKYYQDGTNDKGNAATDIKAVRNEKDITSYIVGYVSKKDTFKREFIRSSNKKKFVISDKCEVSNHYYLKENYRQVECTTGEVREYKRQIHGRIWSASHNLNETAHVLSSSCDGYSEVMEIMSSDAHCKTITHKIVKKPTGDEIINFDFYRIHIHKKKLLKLFPSQLKKEICSKINALIVNDVKQTRIEVDSIF